MGEPAIAIGETRLPRHPVRRTILATAALLTSTAAVNAAWAQASLSGLYDPSLNGGAGQSSFSRNRSGQTRSPRQFQQAQSTESAQQRSADDTGFVSTAPPAAGDSGFVSTAPLAAQDSIPTEPVLGAEPDEPLGEALPAEVATDDGIVPVPARPRRRRAETEDPYEPLGLRLGTFVVKPAIEMSGGYDTNPERERRARGNVVLSVAPELQVRSDWSRHELRADVRGRYQAYPGLDAEPSLDRPFVDAKVAARIDVTRRTRAELEGRFSLSTDDPNSPDLPAGIAELPVTTTTGATAGVVQAFNRLELGVSGSYDRLVYADSLLTNGTIVSNADRNYDQFGGKLSGSYEIVPSLKPFVEVSADRRVHDLPVDAFGFRRDSIGYEARVGATFELTRLITGTGSVGYALRHYEDPALRDIDGLLADGTLVYTATPLTRLTFLARSRINESTLPGVSGVLRRDFGGQIDHAFRRWLIGTVRFEYGFDEYVGSTREDERFTIAGLVTYKLSREVQLKGEVRRQWLTSNVRGAEYMANIFLLGLRLQR